MFALPCLVHAAGWIIVRQPDGQTLNGADIESDVLLSVGEGGAVVVSKDDGATWLKKNSGVTRELLDVFAISKTKAVAVGKGGVIIQTTNGGDAWTRVTPTGLSAAESVYDLHAVVFPSSSVGYAVGGNSLVLKTTNGGSTWNKIVSPSFSGASVSLNDVVTASSSKIWVVGDSGAIAVSSNGGKTWTNQSSNTSNDLLAIAFVDSKRGFVVGADRTLLKTTNAGATWVSVQASGLANDDDINDIVFGTGSSGMLTGASGTMLETNDKGDTWSLMPSSASSEIRGLIQTTKNARWGFGAGGVVYMYDSSAPSKPLRLDVEGENNSVTDSTPTFTWDEAEDDTTIDYYKFQIDDGSYSNIGDTTTFTYDTKLSSGKHTARLYAVDEAGNTGSVASLTFTVSVGAISSGGGAVKVGRVSPTSAITGKTPTFSATVSGGVSVVSCVLYQDNVRKKSMTLRDGIAQTTLSFKTSGKYALQARCEDDQGDVLSGKSVSVTVDSGSSHVSSGKLIKMGCGEVVNSGSCEAVYYYGSDGKRHSFPTESVFKSWFEDFDDVVILSASAMAEIPIGSNVIYKPGDTLVKFNTDIVYAVSYGGQLRAIANEEIARAIFGEQWSSLVYDVSISFFGDYRIGDSIESSEDFSQKAVRSATRSIDVTL